MFLRVDNHRCHVSNPGFASALQVNQENGAGLSNLEGLACAGGAHGAPLEFFLSCCSHSFRVMRTSRISEHGKQVVHYRFGPNIPPGELRRGRMGVLGVVWFTRLVDMPLGVNST